jgi:hypothetical protein
MSQIPDFKQIILLEGTTFYKLFLERGYLSVLRRQITQNEFTVFLQNNWKLVVCIRQECTRERGQLGIVGGQEIGANMCDHNVMKAVRGTG